MTQGHDDKGKWFIVQDANVMHPVSGRLILNKAVCKAWRLFGYDMTQAHSKSKMHLTREICFRPRPEDMDILKIQSDEPQKMLLLLYGICDAGDY